jgi:hypothetical protein
VQKILLIAFSAGKVAGANSKKFEREFGCGLSDSGDRFLVQGCVGDYAAGTDVLAGQFELGFDQDQQVGARLRD